MGGLLIAKIVKSIKVKDMEMKIKTLEEFAELINSSEEWKLEFNEIIKENGWEDLTDIEWEICREGKRMLILNEGAEAIIIEE